MGVGPVRPRRDDNDRPLRGAEDSALLPHLQNQERDIEAAQGPAQGELVEAGEGGKLVQHHLLKVKQAGVRVRLGQGEAEGLLFVNFCCKTELKLVKCAQFVFTWELPEFGVVD